MSQQKKLTVTEIKEIIRQTAKEIDAERELARRDFQEGSDEFDFELENDPMPVDIPDSIMVSFENSN